MKKILLIAAAMLLGSSGAWALGTTAGTWIDNNATLTYSAGGVLQPEVNASLNTRNAADSFRVDKKVDMVLVTTDSDQIEVTPGQTDRITHFAFTNEGNADQNFTFTVKDLTSSDPENGDADYNTKSDNDDVKSNSLEIQCTYTDKNGDTQTATWANSFTLEIKENGTAECNVSADINDPDNTPETNDAGKGDDGDIMNIELRAEAVSTPGNPESNSSGETADDIDVVLADGVTDKTHTTSTLGKIQSEDNSSKGDKPGDGEEAARSGYIIQTPVLTVKKKSCVYSDPANGKSSNAKRIPGAEIMYVIDIQNNGSADAKNMTISDKIASKLLYDTITSGSSRQSNKVSVDENITDDCSCPNGNETTEDYAQDNTGSSSAKELKVEGVSVASPAAGSESHTCISFTVEIE